VVFGFLDAVGVVASALDDTRVGALAVLVEDPAVGDVGGHAGEGPAAVVRGKAGSATRRRMTRTALLNLTRSGPVPALAAAVQIRALIA
jgi:hypothetical protein